VASRSGVKVALPKANAAGAVTKRRTDPVLTVTKNNELYLWNRRVEPARLEEEIRNALTEVDSETLLLRGDKSVFLGAAVDLMAVAKKAGAKNIAILTQADQKP
jgi:biopolymer transport protein ExbD